MTDKHEQQAPQFFSGCDHGVVAGKVCGICKGSGYEPAAPEIPPQLAQWEDPAVQTIYEILCDDLQYKPDDEHWEGYCARWAVASAVNPLRQELTQWRTWGIIEIAVRNPNVASYMDHWESRATKAEQELAALRAEEKEKP